MSDVARKTHSCRSYGSQESVCAQGCIRCLMTAKAPSKSVAVQMVASNMPRPGRAVTIAVSGPESMMEAVCGTTGCIARFLISTFSVLLPNRLFQQGTLPLAPPPPNIFSHCMMTPARRQLVDALVSQYSTSVKAQGVLAGHGLRPFLRPAETVITERDPLFLFSR